MVIMVSIAAPAVCRRWQQELTIARIALQQFYIIIVLKQSNVRQHSSICCIKTEEAIRYKIGLARAQEQLTIYIQSHSDLIVLMAASAPTKLNN